LKILFAGTPEFAENSLGALIAAGHEIVAVYTQPDRPSGRGQKITASPIKKLAASEQLAIHQPITLRDPLEQQFICDLSVDLMIVVAYGLILPAKILSAPKLGCLNVHASLLPRWRGAAPIQHAILAGDNETGVTIMQMEAGLDTGPMLSKATCPIDENDTGGSLHDKLAILGAELLINTIADLKNYPPQKQDNNFANYAHKISRQDAKINWSDSAVKIERIIRAFNPWPVAFTEINNKLLRIWSAKLISTEKSTQPAGCILQANHNGIDVSTGDGILRLQTIQLAGGKALPVSDILNARHDDFLPGNIFK